MGKTKLDAGIYTPEALTRRDYMGIRYFAAPADTGTGVVADKETETTDAKVDEDKTVVEGDSKEPETAPKPEAETETPEVEEKPEEVKEPEVGSDGRIDAKEFDAFKKARNAENKSLRDRLRNLERAEIIRETGLTAEQLDLLKGETPEELRKAAEAFKAILGQSTSTKDEEEKKEEVAKPQPKTFTTPPKASVTSTDAGVSDIVARKDYNALKEILNQGKK